MTTMPTVLTQAMQDYLKAIYTLSRRRGPTSVRTTDLALRLRVSPASATNMVKRLARLRLVEHTPYRSVDLTETGKTIALEIIRHHRLIELFLRTHLGLSLDQVHGEAEALEHVLSEEVESRITAVLANPVLDPHGKPIPPKRNRARPQVTWAITARSSERTNHHRCVDDSLMDPEEFLPPHLTRS